MTEDNQTPIRIDLEDLPPEVRPGAGPVGPHRERMEVLSVLSLGLGILSVVFAGVAIGPVAMICGVVAVVRTKGPESRGQAAAAVGIALGISGTVLWTILIWYFAVRPAGSREARTSPSPPMSVGALDRSAVESAPGPIRRALLSNVSVIVERNDPAGWAPVSFGSGTVIKRDVDRFYVLTCRHVLPDGGRNLPADRVRLLWVGGEGNDIRIEWQADAPFDLAILSTTAPDLTAQPTIVPIGDSRTMRVSESVFAIGDPVNYRTSYVTGVISAARTLREGAMNLRVFQSQVPINPGNSGGGLYNSAGELIAINTWKMKDEVAEGIGFSIAIENLWVALKSAPPILTSIFAAQLGPVGSGSSEADATPGPGSPPNLPTDGR